MNSLMLTAHQLLACNHLYQMLVPTYEANSQVVQFRQAFMEDARHIKTKWIAEEQADIETFKNVDRPLYGDHWTMQSWMNLKHLVLDILEVHPWHAG